MKLEYKNWIPKFMVYGLIGGIIFTIILLIAVNLCIQGLLQIVLNVLLVFILLVCWIGTEWCISAYKAFSYDGKRKLSKQIVEGIAKCVTIPNGGIGLDVGC